MPGAASYAAFVDRSPVAPQERAPRPAIDVLVAAEPTVVIDRMMGQAASKVRDHHIVVIAVDRSGRRLGERAGVVDVRIDPLAAEAAP